MTNLCVLCRNVGHRPKDCPHGQQFEAARNGDPGSEEALVSGLSSNDDALCLRCSAFDITHILTEVDVQDELDYTEVTEEPSDGNYGWATRGHLAVIKNKQHHLDLGPLQELVLLGSCPLCRLIFRIFPRKIEPESHESSYYLKPVRSYNRLGDRIPEVDEESRKQYAVYVAVESRDEALTNRSHFLGDPQDTMVFGTDYTFALSDQSPAERRPGLSARRRNANVDISLLKSWLSRCEEHHGDNCHVQWSDELLTCRMVDVHKREVVPCPPSAKYIALSYVWGQASPQPYALENHSLPKTIEDAITLTKELGLQYLWVDALCIDQVPSPEKTQQLAMMDLIYACAWLTIVALHGTSGDAGLCGMGEQTNRAPQGREVINGREILQLFPTHAQEMAAARYWTRAWTFQEFMLSRRRLMFGQHQVHYGCNLGRYAETINNFMDPQHLLEKLLKPELGFSLNDGFLDANEKTRLEFADDEYCALIPLYTERQMTNDSDSLNAFLGIAQQLRKTVVPSGLEWGLPLHDFPQSLRWFHPRSVKPRRRPDFPSWSWTGWEGQVTYSDPLNLLRGQKSDASTDMTAQFLNVEDKIMLLEAHQVTLEIRTEPFSEAYLVGGDSTLLGSLQEGNHLHRNTIPSGTHDFVVIERLLYRVAPDRPLRQTVYMLMLERDGALATRNAFVRLYMEPGVDFAQAVGSMAQVQLV